MKKLVLGIGLCSSLVAGACPPSVGRCLVGLAALVGLTIAGCTDNTPPANAPYYAPPGTSSSNYSSSYESHSETVNGETTTTFSGEITEDGKTKKYDDPAQFNRDNPRPRFQPNRLFPTDPQ